MTDSLPAAAPDATGDPDLEDLRRRNSGRGLLIQRTSMSGYSFKVIQGSETRFVTEGEDPQDVIDECFS